jgi:hypothetical protein
VRYVRGIVKALKSPVSSGPIIRAAIRPPRNPNKEAAILPPKSAATERKAWGLLAILDLRPGKIFFI